MPGEESNQWEWDPSLLSYEEFVELFFARPVAANEYGPGDALDGFDSPFEFRNPAVIIDHLTRLFRDFSTVAATYSLEQVDQALGAIIGTKFELTQCLWRREICLQDRLACIGAMYEVYADFVAPNEAKVMAGCFDMWWDMLAEGFWGRQDAFSDQQRDSAVAKLESEDRQLLDKMFETLSRILNLPDQRTQSFALHGLGHLHHPRVPALIDDYVKREGSNWTPEGLKWIAECRAGTVM